MRALVVCISWWLARSVPNLIASENKTSHGQTIFGLKLASSGSTWFWETLVSVRGTHIEQELYTKSSGNNIEPAKKTEMMVKKLSPRDCSAGAVCGFTINPKNSRGVDWETVGAAAGCVVGWQRTNIMKMTISSVRKIKYNVCGGRSKVRAKKPNSTASCGNHTNTFAVGDVEEKLIWLAGYESELAEAVAAAKRRANCSVDMTYEDLQRDEDGELERLFVAKLGFSSPLARKFIKKSAKRTSDDIRDVMENFKTIADYLAALGVEDACPLGAMLRETKYVAFPRCDHAAVVRAACAARARAGRKGMSECDEAAKRDSEAGGPPMAAALPPRRLRAGIGGGSAAPADSAPASLGTSIRRVADDLDESRAPPGPPAQVPGPRATGHGPALTKRPLGASPHSFV